MKTVLLLALFFTLFLHPLQGQRDFSSSEIAKLIIPGSGNPNPTPDQSGSKPTNDLGWRVRCQADHHSSTLCRGKREAREAVTIYLFPGQGADYRQYSDLRFPEGYDTVHISYPVPHYKESMTSFARSFIPLINQEQPYILVGVSLGGMICTELADILHPLQVILISSAKGRSELPGRYTFMAKFHLNRLVPKRLVKFVARSLQGIVEPDRKYHRSTFRDMLKKKDPLYLKRSADMIVCWDREQHQEKIIHIHGDADHTIPIENVEYDYLVEEGSHMMVLTRANEISMIIYEILNGNL